MRTLYNTRTIAIHDIAQAVARYSHVKGPFRVILGDSEEMEQLSNFLNKLPKKESRELNVLELLDISQIVVKGLRAQRLRRTTLFWKPATLQIMEDMQKKLIQDTDGIGSLIYKTVAMLDENNMLTPENFNLLRRCFTKYSSHSTVTDGYGQHLSFHYRSAHDPKQAEIEW